MALLMLVALSVCFSSCSDDDDGNALSGNGLTGIGNLEGTKWTTENWDIDFGDDWISTMDEVAYIYFYNSTEGLVYYYRKDSYSDDGTSYNRTVAHFTYTVSGNEITLDYITDPVYNVYYLTIDGSVLTSNGTTFSKGTIDYSDTKRINTTHGTTGECKWYHNLKSSIWIEGKGDMADYTSYSQTPWAKNDLYVSYVYIGDDVTSIGSYAFANYSVFEVSGGSSFTKISKGAFTNSCITDMSFPSTLKTIGEDAFAGCTAFNAAINAEVEYIYDSAFYGCKSARFTYGEKKLKHIGAFAFAGCTVSSFLDSQVLEEIGMGAFTDCDFTTLELPNSLKTIGNSAFSGRGIKTIYVGSGLTSVSGTPFYPSSRGSIYVNRKTPLGLSYPILDPNSIKNWTLYVPIGCSSAYSKAGYWSDFGKIQETNDFPS